MGDLPLRGAAHQRWIRTLPSPASVGALECVGALQVWAHCECGRTASVGARRVARRRRGKGVREQPHVDGLGQFRPRRGNMVQLLQRRYRFLDLGEDEPIGFRAGVLQLGGRGGGHVAHRLSTLRHRDLSSPPLGRAHRGVEASSPDETAKPALLSL